MIDDNKELLLKSVFLDGQAAEEAWRQWQSHARLDDADLSDYQLLPLLHAHGYGSDDPRIRGIHRRTRYANRLLIHKALAIADEMRSRCLRVAVGRESVAVLTDLGCYPLDRFHLVIREADAVAAVDVLEREGWQVRGPRPSGDVLSISPVINFDNGADVIVQLHRVPVWDEAYWNRTAILQYEGRSLAVAGIEDRFLDTAAPACSWHRVPMFLRVAGAMTVIRQSGAQFDWDYLAEKTDRRRLALPLLDVVTYAVDKLAAPIAPHLIDRLQAMGRSTRADFEYRCRTGRATLWRRLAILWFDYRRLKEDTEASAPGFSEFVRVRWQPAGRWQIPRRELSRFNGRH